MGSSSTTATFILYARLATSDVTWNDLKITQIDEKYAEINKNKENLHCGIEKNHAKITNMHLDSST